MGTEVTASVTAGLCPVPQGFGDVQRSLGGGSAQWSLEMAEIGSPRRWGGAQFRERGNKGKTAPEQGQKSEFNSAFEFGALCTKSRVCARGSEQGGNSGTAESFLESFLSKQSRCCLFPALEPGLWLLS